MSDYEREEDRGSELSDYVPLIALTLVSAAGGVAYAAAGDIGLSVRDWMHGFMGIFLLVYGLLKLFDLPHFANGFEMYDLLAMRWRGWGYIYPFVEVSLGLAFLAQVAPALVYTLTAVVMGFGAIGVILALRRGVDIECPCMGNVLHVPLSTVTLTEDLAVWA